MRGVCTSGGHDNSDYKRYKASVARTQSKSPQGSERGFDSSLDKRTSELTAVDDHLEDTLTVKKSIIVVAE